MILWIKIENQNIIEYIFLKKKSVQKKPDTKLCNGFL